MAKEPWAIIKELIYTTATKQKKMKPIKSTRVNRNREDHQMDFQHETVEQSAIKPFQDQL